MPSGPYVSFEEYEAWLDEDIWAEWENGVIVRLPTATTQDRLIAAFLITLIQFWIEGKEIGGEVLPAPYLMRATPGGSGREPDILYIAPENRDCLSKTRLNGPADLVIEIVTPESRRRDRNIKFFEYASAGVREYWMLDPDTADAEFYRRDDSGFFRRVPLTGGAEGKEGAIYTSEVLEGLTLDTAWLWQSPLPTLMSVLKSWGIID